MRIALDRRKLLGFETARNVVSVPENVAKVGTKDAIVLTASHADLLRPVAMKTELTFPA